MTRSEHRRCAFALIYRLAFIDPIDPEKAYADYVEYLITEAAPGFNINKLREEYIKTPLIGVLQHKDQIDAVIKKCLINWELSRIATVDLAILRLAVYEIMYEPDIPEAVSINEAVMIAKQYGADDSPAFINGALAKVVRELK